jgi:hypothetical protein
MHATTGSRIPSEKEAFLAEVVARSGFELFLRHFANFDSTSKSKSLQQFIHVMPAAGIGFVQE